MVDKIGFMNWFERRLISLSLKNPQKTIAEIRKLFLKYDKDKSNSMDKDEFRVFFWWIQAYFDAIQQFLWLDKDNSGSINVKEFKTKAKWLYLPPSFQGTVENQFKKFDPDNKGQITLHI